MGILSTLRSELSSGAEQPQVPQLACLRCPGVTMVYRGAKSLRVGGLNGTLGAVGDLMFGARDEEALNQALEKKHVIHVFVCPDCGEISMLNDPKHGF